MSTLLYFLLFGALFFFMMRFGCGAHVMGHGGKQDRGPSDSPQANDGSIRTASRWVPPEKDTDPVCGMTVDPSSAKPSLYDGQVYYFCAETCRQKFEADPARFIASSVPPEPMEPLHEH